MKQKSQYEFPLKESKALGESADSGWRSGKAEVEWGSPWVSEGKDYCQRWLGPGQRNWLEGNVTGQRWDNLETKKNDDYNEQNPSFILTILPCFWWNRWWYYCNVLILCHEICQHPEDLHDSMNHCLSW